MIAKAEQPDGRPGGTQMDRDLKVLARFVEIYCRDRHAEADRRAVSLKRYDLGRIHGGAPTLCDDCTRLLTHAFCKRAHCPLDPKPSCKHCTQHCYHPRYRAAIRDVMRYSGRRLVLSGRLDYLIKLLF